MLRFVVIRLVVSFVAFLFLILARFVVLRLGCLSLFRFGLCLVVSFYLAQVLVTFICVWVGSVRFR